MLHLCSQTLISQLCQYICDSTKSTYRSLTKYVSAHNANQVYMHMMSVEPYLLGVLGVNMEIILGADTFPHVSMGRFVCNRKIVVIG